MSIEEKAKAYDEALEKARIYRDNAKAVEEYSAVARYENIFPELRESEEERIVNWLYDMLKHGMEDAPKGCPDNPIAEKALAWLEKQKEQEHICDSAQFEEGFKTGLEIGLRKQKEQKLISFNEPYNPDEGEVVMEGNAISLNRKEQKPADYCSVRDEFDLDGNLKPKPVEWSEEDEKMLHSALWHIANSVTNGKLTECKCDLTVWLEEKLKSLRPSWKPSKELMKALGASIVFHKGDPFVEKLLELYNQLQKL